MKFLGRAFAATAAAPGSVASHNTAGVLWKLEGVVSQEVEILTEHGRRAQLRGVITHRTRLLERSDLAKIGAIPVTRPIRTLIDLASVLSAGALEDALDDALRRLVRLDGLKARLLSEPHRGRRGVRTLTQLVEARTPMTVAGSGRENAVRRALVKAGLPQPVRQYEIFDESGGFVARVDLAYPQARVYIEYDGVQHSDLRHWERDLDRQNRLSELDWLPLRFTKGALARSDGALVERVKSVLGARNDNHGA